MKMVKSYTQKKFVKKSQAPHPTQLALATDAATDYIKHWTRKELGKLQDNRDASICIPTKTGYKIGLFNLRVFANKTCEVRDRNDESVHVFENKISAVLYTIYSIKGSYWISDQILQLDREINKCSTDVLSLRRTMEQARLRGDFVTVDTRLARLEMAENQLNLARDKISKIHKTAKYNKVWE
jgi:hypothetical protein